MLGMPTLSEESENEMAMSRWNKQTKLRNSANNSEISLNGCVTEKSIDGQIYYGDSRLPLQSTVFRPVASGSVGGELRDNNIPCGLIRDSDLNKALNTFRELESIGAKNENCSSEEVISLEMCKQRECFKNGRYEVALPWKRDSNELSDNFSLAKRRLGSLRKKMQSDERGVVF
ncbi:DUF1758 domain-containing protein [Trichonephila clavipes]|nr:DUF1758 domain-containing protein [Trichonephila clavipes]